MAYNKPNYELKAKLIENGKVKLKELINLTNFKKYQEDKKQALTGIKENLNKPFPFEFAQMLLEDNFNDIERIECDKILNASYHRTKRLSDRIQNMLLSGQCIFLTLTFTDKVLESTNQDTRKRYVKRYLKEVSNQYVANIDYGSKNEREHYHAIVLCDKVKYSFWHKYGAIKGEIIKLEDNTSKKLGKYVAKLTNHAIKETVRRNCVIYSR